MSNVLRLLRSVNDSPAVFLRPGHNDHKLICQLMSEGRAGVAGVVFDAAFTEEQEELRNATNAKNLWSVLDTKMLELSTPGGYTARRKVLPWAGSKPHVLSDFDGERSDELARKIAEFVVQHRFSAVLAATHYLSRGFNDPWFAVDLRSFEQLRRELDGIGGRDVAIYFPLCLPTSVFFDSAQRLAVKSALRNLRGCDALWLRIHPFGGHSGHVTLVNYIRAARDMQEAGIALVGEKVGAVGPALLAFGALGGLDVGVSSGESFDFKRLLKKYESGKGFAPHRGVLLEALGLTLDVRSARGFFENRTLRAQYACKDANCCRQGFSDTLKEPRRHFVLSELNRVSKIGAAPYQDRPGIYLERMLRPATDRLSRLAQAEVPNAVLRRVESEQRKYSGWRNTLGELSSVPLLSAAKVPAKRVERFRGAA